MISSLVSSFIFSQYIGVSQGASSDSGSSDNYLDVYSEAKKTMAIITTSETRPYGCFIFTKGVLKPDGTVWII